MLKHTDSFGRLLKLNDIIYSQYGTEVVHSLTENRVNNRLPYDCITINNELTFDGLNHHIDELRAKYWNQVQSGTKKLEQIKKGTAPKSYIICMLNANDNTKFIDGNCDIQFQVVPAPTDEKTAIGLGNVIANLRTDIKLKSGNDQIIAISTMCRRTVCISNDTNEQMRVNYKTTRSEYRYERRYVISGQYFNDAPNTRFNSLANIRKLELTNQEIDGIFYTTMTRSDLTEWAKKHKIVLNLK